MRKFNVGDKVNIINTGAFVGLTGKGVVTNPNDNHVNPIEVECEVDDFTQRLNFSESDLELIDEKVDINGDFSKDDLESGMLIRDRGGVLRKVLIGSGVGKMCGQDGRYTLLDYLDDGLTSAGGEIFDIMEVYEPRNSEYFFNFDVDNHELIWSRLWKVVQKYYLKDEFIGKYLTHIVSESKFYLGGKTQLPDYQTQFTDDEIEKLDIPVERFKKIPVED